MSLIDNLINKLPGSKQRNYNKVVSLISKYRILTIDDLESILDQIYQNEYQFSIYINDYNYINNLIRQVLDTNKKVNRHKLIELIKNKLNTDKFKVHAGQYILDHLVEMNSNYYSEKYTISLRDIVTIIKKLQIKLIIGSKYIDQLTNYIEAKLDKILVEHMKESSISIRSLSNTEDYIGYRHNVRDLGSSLRDFAIVDYNGKILKIAPPYHHIHLVERYEKEHSDYDEKKVLGFAEAYDDIAIIVNKVHGSIEQIKSDLKREYKKVYMYAGSYVDGRELNELRRVAKRLMKKIIG